MAAHHGYVVENVVGRDVTGKLVADELCQNGLRLSNVLRDLLVDPWAHSLLNETLDTQQATMIYSTPFVNEGILPC